MRILVLEDHFAIRDELVALIEKMGHAAVPVGDALEAIEAMKVTAVDAVITDVFVERDGGFLPEGGVRLIGVIRFARENGLKVDRRVPILAISGGRAIPGGYSPLRIARDVGADFCMQKPLDMDEVAVWIMDTEIALESQLQPRSV